VTCKLLHSVVVIIVVVIVIVVPSSPTSTSSATTIAIVPLLFQRRQTKGGPQLAARSVGQSRFDRLLPAVLPNRTRTDAKPVSSVAMIAGSIFAAGTSL